MEMKRGCVRTGMDYLGSVWIDCGVKKTQIWKAIWLNTDKYEKK